MDAVAGLDDEDRNNCALAQPDNAKTRQATRYGVRLFREYCSQHGVEAIGTLSPKEIAAMLKGFYGQARTKDGQRFSVNSLIAIRYAISRYYRSPQVSRKIDIVKDSAFGEANETFRAVLKDLERESRGAAAAACDREPLLVDMDDRRRLRHYFEHAVATPRGLLQKVWYDLMLRVGRRGRESQRLLNRNSFRVAKTADGRQYIYQVEDEEAGIILEIPGDPLCPVKTLKFYLSRLNPACRALFQRPKDHVYEQDTCWYVNSPVGKNMLATMMSTISKCARLSRVYTNVRIRATTYSPAADANKTDGPQPSTSASSEASSSSSSQPDIKPLTTSTAALVTDTKKAIESQANSHIIKQLQAPIVQLTMPSQLFPLSLTKKEVMNGQATPDITNLEPRVCAWCRKNLSGMVLKSNDGGKQYCSTECLGKMMSAERHSDAEETSSNLRIQKLLTLCSSANLLIPFPSLAPSVPPHLSLPGLQAVIPQQNETQHEVITNGCSRDDSRSSSPLMIVPDEVYPEAILETEDSDLDNMDSDVEENGERSQSVRDQGTMCAPVMVSCSTYCKPLTKSQGIQTDFSTYFCDPLDRHPFLISSNRGEEPEESGVEEMSDEFLYQSLDESCPLWMSVESDEDEPMEEEEEHQPDLLPDPSALVKIEVPDIPEPIAASVYSQRGRTTKRTTWDEIAQRSKLQTLWGVKVFREWLQSKGLRNDFERLDSVSLANTLEEFYGHLTKPDGEEYSVSTMHTIRASVSRYLTLPPQSKPFSIIRDREFKRANEAFYRRIRRLQQPPLNLPPVPQHTQLPPQAFGFPRWQTQLATSNGPIMLVQLGPR